jgi:hypothetical protein
MGDIWLTPSARVASLRLAQQGEWRGNTSFVPPSHATTRAGGLPVSHHGHVEGVGSPGTSDPEFMTDSVMVPRSIAAEARGTVLETPYNQLHEEISTPSLARSASPGVTERGAQHSLPDGCRVTATCDSEPMDDVCHPDPHEPVERARAALLTSGTAVTVEQLVEATGRSIDAVRLWFEREAERLVTVTCDGTLLIPTVQLDDAFELDEKVAERTRRLIEFDMGPWAIWDWWQAPNGWLDGRAPADAAASGDFDGVDRAIDGVTK